MYFTKSLAAFVALTAFMTSTIAAPTKTPAKAPATGAKPVAKASGPLVAGSGVFAKIKASQATWDKASQLCAGGKKKRDFDDDYDLEARAAPAGYTNVAMGTAGSTTSILGGLWTEGLVTCFGVAVVGTASTPIGENHFLLHSTASKQLNGWDDFEKKVKAAKATKMQGWISVPDLTAGLPAGFNEEDKALNKQMAEEIEGHVKALIGSSPKVVKRHMEPASSMKISKEGKVYVNEKEV